MNNHFISVVIPTYKPQEYIFYCLDSLVTQSLSSQAFQIIIVLNGEKDPYFEKIADYIKDKINFHLIYSERAGVSTARNIGIQEANGSHVIFIDDDDFISAGFLEQMYMRIKDSPTSLIASNFLRFFNDQETKDDYMTSTYQKLLKQDEKTALFKYRKILSSACGKAIPKLMIANIRFKEDVKISEDALFLFEISKNIKKIILCPMDVIYYRRVRNLSASRTHRSSKEQLTIFIRNVVFFTKIYLSSISKYSFFLYINRILANFKYFLFNFLRK